MGKIRVKVLGDEKAEKQQQEEARKRAEARRAEKTADIETAGKTAEAESKSSKSAKPAETSAPAKSKYAAKTVKQKHSKKYLEAKTKIDKTKNYNLDEALNLLPQLKLTKFDESVELHINTIEKGVSGNLTLPHGSGKQTRITIVNLSEDPKSVEELIKKIEAGNIDFDVLLATPESMPKLARVARYLGPRGLMPNPKNGTVTPKPEEVAKKYEGGQINYKTEAKFPILHLTVGKLSFGEKKLSENIKTAIEAIQAKNISNLTLKSTMSPGIKIALSSLQ